MGGDGIGEVVATAGEPAALWAGTGCGRQGARGAGAPHGARRRFRGSGNGASQRHRDAGQSPVPGVLAAIKAALWNEDPLVRAAGITATNALPPDDRVEMLAPLLADSIRLVRIDAARSLAGATPGLLTPDQSKAYAVAIAEYRDEQAVNADRAEARLNLGAYFAEIRQPDSAATEYAVALHMNPSLLATYVNLADLYRQEGRDSAAERVLHQGLSEAPKGSGAELQYALGLTMVREKRYSDAIPPLRAATTLAPDSPRFALAYALVLQKLGRANEAKSVLEGALAKHPDDHDLASAYVSVVKPGGAPTQ